MAWLRIRLTEEQQQVVNEERSAHPNPRVREKMRVRPVNPFLRPMLRSGHGRKGVNHGSCRAVAWQP